MLKVWTYVASQLAALRRDERGVTALEYGVIAAFILIAIITALGLISNELRETFNRIATELARTPEE